MTAVGTENQQSSDRSQPGPMFSEQEVPTTQDKASPASTATGLATSGYDLRSSRSSPGKKLTSHGPRPVALLALPACILMYTGSIKPLDHTDTVGGLCIHHLKIILQHLSPDVCPLQIIQKSLRCVLSLGSFPLMVLPCPPCLQQCICRHQCREHVHVHACLEKVSWVLSVPIASHSEQKQQTLHGYPQTCHAQLICRFTGKLTLDPVRIRGRKIIQGGSS